MRTNATLEAAQKASHSPFVHILGGAETQRENFTTSPTGTTSVYGDQWRAQTFTPQANQILGIVKIKAYRGGSPGKLTASITAVDGSSLPTGPDLCSGSINSDDFTTNSTGVEYTIPLSYASLTSGTKYALVLRCLNGDVNNSIGLKYNASGGYANGAALVSTDGGGSWSALGTGDLYFDTYSYPLVVATNDYRIKSIEGNEEPWGINVTITLNNQGSLYDSQALQGAQIRLGIGADCANGIEVVYRPYVWCYAQDFISDRRPGAQDVYVIHAEGAPDKIGRYTCDAHLGYRFNQDDATYQNYNMEEIIDFVAEKAGSDLGADIGTLDGKVDNDSWEPQATWESKQTGREFLDYTMERVTRCVLVPRTTKVHLKYCQDGDSVDYTYLSDAAHYFRKSHSRSLYFKKMKVEVYTAAYSGDYASTSPAWDSSMGIWAMQEPFGLVGSDADCEWIAQSMVERAQSQTETGFLITTPNYLQEVYDKVTVTDNRGNTGATGRVGGLYWRYYPESRDPFLMELRIGGLIRKRNTDDVEAFIDQLALGSGMTAPNIIKMHTISPDLLRRAGQPFNVDIVWTSVDGNSVSWGAGTIYFADGSSQAVDAGSKDDVSGTDFAYFLEGNATIQWSSNYNDAAASNKGLLAVVVEGTNGQSAIVLPNKSKEPIINATIIAADSILAAHVKAGEISLAAVAAQGKVTGDLDAVSDGTTYGRVLLTDISAGHIILSETVGDLDDIADGTSYGRVAKTDISSGHILLSTCTGSIDNIAEGSTNKYFNGKDVDDLPDGTTYKRILATDLSSGHIKLTSATVVDGEWYNESGVEIDASHGINIYGTNNALTTRATKAGTVQCSVNSSGQITAGAGSVLIDADGIKIYGDVLKFYSGATLIGGMYGAATYLDITAQSNKDLRLNSSGTGDITLNPGDDINLEADTYVTGKIEVSGFADLRTSDSFAIPCYANDAAKPGTPYEGMICYMEDDDDIEFYKNGAWHVIHAF